MRILRFAQLPLKGIDGHRHMSTCLEQTKTIKLDDQALELIPLPADATPIVFPSRRRPVGHG